MFIFINKFMTRPEKLLILLKYTKTRIYIYVLKSFVSYKIQIDFTNI